jgi:hypothetical protein
MYGELASVQGIVDLSPQEALDQAEGFLASQGYIIEQRTFTTVMAQRHPEGGAAGQDPLNLTVAVAPQANGGVRVVVRGTDEAGVRERQAAWLEWSESLPKKPESETAGVPLSPPPQVESADLPPPQAPSTREWASTATATEATPRSGRSLGFWALVGAGGCLTLIVLLVGLGAILAASSSGGGEAAEEPKQERKAAQQKPPQKNDQPEKKDQSQQKLQAQGGQQEQQGGGGQEPEPKESSFASFGDGTYQVGTDVQPGTYRTRAGSPNCYWERLRNFSGGMNGILANGTTSAPSIVTIESTDVGFNSQGCGTWTKDLSAITNSKTSFGAGAYIVGTDIDAGTYRNSGGENCYYERLRGFNGGMNAIITNGTSSNPSIVAIAPTDAGFQSNGCGTWTKLE